MIGKKVIVVVCVLICINVSAQNWISTNINADRNIFSFSLDSVNNLLYVGGDFTQIGGKTTYNGIGIWDGTNWDTLPNKLNGSVGSLCKYKGKLYVSGVFYPAPFNCPNIGFMSWDGVKWDSVGIGFWYGGGVTYGPSMKIMNGDLYFYGAFDSIMNLSASSIVKFDGTNWTSFNFPVKDKFIRGIEYYDGELYAIGSFVNLNGNPNMDFIVKYNGTNWVSVPGANFQDAISVESICAYKGELYVGGYFMKSQGCPGNGIAKLNSTGWHEVNGGFSYMGFPNSICRQMDVKKGILYLQGDFDHLGSFPAKGLVTYDGIKFCTLDTTLSTGFGPIEIFNNKIILGRTINFGVNNQDTLWRMAQQNKFTFDTCQTYAIGVNEILSKDYIKIYPNPVSNILHIESEQYFEAGTQIEITNCLGQVVFKSLFKKELDVSRLNSGCYFILISNEREKLNYKFIKQ
jgi:hypothetical protein